MMVDPNPRDSKMEEEVFEWIRSSSGSIIKVTKKNSYGRKCGKCGCNCPCRCEDCKPICCTFGNTITFMVK